MGIFLFLELFVLFDHVTLMVPEVLEVLVSEESAQSG